ncbi:TPA: prophage tail fiber N-terminal domain-containing protein [Escherichia coli]|nr:prophage tail fiber N-terminal domain-containing protein [Escherichia coli]HBI2749322.1 prophage tail fiber N-terminal domain-containing protein [Escherichia coli]
MTVKISGVLKDGLGNAIPDCMIELKSLRTSSTVIVKTVATASPGETGSYALQVEPGDYAVTLHVEGYPPAHVGDIAVYTDSAPGTLNDFLGAPGVADLRPEALRRFEEILAETRQNVEATSQSAEAAKKSETAAASSKNAAKTSETNSANSAKAAAASQTASATSATAAKKSETNAKASETAAKSSETNAKSSQTAAKTSETNAKASESAAKNSQNASANSESAAAGSATAAASSQKDAKTSETNAKSSQTAAKASETNAKASETAAKTSQDAAARSESAAAGSASSAAASATASANSQKAAKTSETNAKASETVAVNSAKAAATSQSAAKASEDAAREYAEQTAEPYANIVPPLPDVWIPFNDSLDMITGYSPGYKKVKIGDDVVQVASDKQVNFTRASTATYIDKSGCLQTAAENEPRFEREGLLIEGQRTNYMLNSENPASWGRTQNMDVPETGTDSFGFLWGKFVCNDSLIGQTSAINMASIAATKSVDVSGDNKYVTTSCRFKTELQLRLRIRFDKYDGSATTFLGDAYIDTQTLAIKKTGVASDRIIATAKKDEMTGWVFVEATIQAIDGELKIGSQIQYAPKEGGETVSGDHVYLATPQVENGPCVSSFIISGAAATTRASDMVTIPARNNIFKQPVSVLIEINKNWNIAPNGAPRIFDLNATPSFAEESFIFAFRGPTSVVLPGSAYVSVGSPSRGTGNNEVVTAGVYGVKIDNDDNLVVSLNGNISSKVSTSWKGVIKSTMIRIGGQTNTGERHLFGHIRNFRIWHKELNDRQLKEAV